MGTRRFPLLAVLIAVAALLALPARSALAVSYVVDTTSDASLTACSGAAADCSLRGAMTNANGIGGADFITFDGAVFPSGAPATIAIASQLPTLTLGSDTIDATNRGVIIDGAGEPSAFDCIRLASNGNTVKGLQLTDCNSGVAVVGSQNTVGPGNVAYDNNFGIQIGRGAFSGNLIAGNRLGTNASGSAVHPNGGNIFDGILMGGSNNVVGGVIPSARNIISGNLSSGVTIFSSDAFGNVVKGNFIGADVTGTVDIGNGRGVVVTASGAFGTDVAFANTIGGTGAGDGNLISGNSSENIQISFGAHDNSISGNVIGPDVNGSGAAMSSGNGVLISNGAASNTIGPGNVISDNSNGVLIGDSGSDRNVVEGNLIGTNLSGIASVANSNSGVFILSSARFNVIGGTAAGDGNVIAFNTQDGVRVDGASGPTTGNSIRGNSIHDNTGFEINTINNGNLDLTPPTLLASDGVTVSGTACPYCVVDIFTDSASDPRHYEGSTTATSGGAFSFTDSGGFTATKAIGTQTDTFGNTSEVSGTIVADFDTDGDGVLNTSDTDDDNDTLLDGSDSCPLLGEDFDGFQDSDGCPDPDNDLDGVCDAGQASASCAGEDFGFRAFYPIGHNHGDIPTGGQDCRNIAEDYDVFKDLDGCPEPDNDNDGHPDVTDDCPGNTNVAGVDGVLGSGEDQNHNGKLDAGEDTVVVDGVLTTDDGVLTFEDYDGILDDDGCHDSPGDDRDGDGFTDENEVLKIGTRADKPCGGDSWPADLLSSGLSANKLDLQDLASFVAPVRRLGTSPVVDANFSARWDLIPGSVVGKYINIQDMAAVVPSNLSSTARPPMFAGTPAFGKVCPLPP